MNKLVSVVVLAVVMSAIVAAASMGLGYGFILMAQALGL